MGEELTQVLEEMAVAGGDGAGGDGEESLFVVVASVGGDGRWGWECRDGCCGWMRRRGDGFFGGNVGIIAIVIIVGVRNCWLLMMIVGIDGVIMGWVCCCCCCRGWLLSFLRHFVVHVFHNIVCFWKN